MKYRITTGAQSEWKKYLTSTALILGLTIGFPVLGAWLNYEAFSPKSSGPVAVEDSEGAVLGENTGDQPEPNNDQTMTITRAPASQELTVSSWKAPTKSKPANPVTVSVEAPIVTPDPPAATTAPVVAAEETPEPDLEVELINNLVDTTVEVTPEPLIDDLGL